MIDIQIQSVAMIDDKYHEDKYNPSFLPRQVMSVAPAPGQLNITSPFPLPAPPPPRYKENYVYE
jgi:hypothetical protein